jgi:hypothetical protein
MRVRADRGGQFKIYQPDTAFGYDDVGQLYVAVDEACDMQSAHGAG